MKKAIVSTITALSVLLAVMMLAGCDLLSPKEDDPPKQTGTEEPETPDTPDTPEGPAVFEKELWGEWLRMDTGEKWYISSSAIKIGRSVSTKTVSLTKQSERTVEVSDGGRKYYLYASRIANTSFTGKIASFDAPSGRALVGILLWRILS